MEPDALRRFCFAVDTFSVDMKQPVGEVLRPYVRLYLPDFLQSMLLYSNKNSDVKRAFGDVNVVMCPCFFGSGLPGPRSQNISKIVPSESCTALAWPPNWLNQQTHACKQC
jgi:hypothetical protein